MNPPRVGIYYTEQGQKESARKLGVALDVPVIADTANYDFALSFANGRLCLSMPNNAALRGKIYAEFVTGAAGYRRSHSAREMLLRAIGFRRDKPPHVLDATGGLGEDSFLMASHGCRVRVLERNRIVAALLQDGLRRAFTHPETHEITGKILLSIQDSLHFLENCREKERVYDVVYLDPMFPERSKNALARKEMQVLQQLIGHEEDAGQLLALALAAATRRVVVKRPKAAPPLAGEKPSHTVNGKTTRFDVYLV